MIPSLDTSHLPQHGSELSPEQLDVLGEEIATFVACRAMQDRAELTRLRLFDEGKGWAGFTSCAQWLSYRTGLNLGTARTRLRVAHALKYLPKIDAAFAKGEISYTKVRVMTPVATPDNEANLLEQAKHATGSELDWLLRPFKSVLRGTPEELAQREEERSLSFSTTSTGMTRIEAVVFPEEGAVAKKALSAATAMAFSAKDEDVPAGALGNAGLEQTQAPAALGPDEQGRVLEQPAFKRVDAFMGVLNAFLGMKSRPSQVPGRYEVVLHVSAEALEGDSESSTSGPCELEDGTRVGSETARRLSCDAPLVRFVRGSDGSVLDVGRRTRTIPPALKRALLWRDRSCTFPGCRREIFLQFHHLKHWARGGKTAAENLAALCSFHHRLCHEGGWTVRRRADERLEFVRPDDHPLPPSPKLPSVSPSDMSTLTEELTSAVDGAALRATAPDRLTQATYPEICDNLFWAFGFADHDDSQPAVEWLRKNTGGGHGPPPMLRERFSEQR